VGELGGPIDQQRCDRPPAAGEARHEGRSLLVALDGHHLGARGAPDADGDDD
jgi:hypothetical protein